MLHYEYHFHVVFIQLFKPLRNYLSSSTLILMGFAIRSSLLGFKGLNLGQKHLYNVLHICTNIFKIIISNRAPNIDMFKYIPHRIVLLLRKIQIKEFSLVFCKLILLPLQFSFLCFTQFSFRFH